jgi:hypothetical protein
MFRRRIMLGLAVCVVGALLLSVALGQAGAGATRGDRGGQRGGGGAQPATPGAQPGARGGQPGGPGGQRFDRAQMRQMMEQRMQEQLASSAEEWKTLGPRVMKVYDLNQQLSASGRGGMFGSSTRRGPQTDQPGAGQGTPARELSAVEKASAQLRTTLEDTAAKPEDITKQLTALRTAKQTTKKELATAQAELRKAVKVRQEAQLVLMGLLD